MPDSATLAPTAAAEVRIILYFSFWTSTPKRYASDSPSCNKSSFLEYGIINAIEAQITNITGIKSGHVTPPKLPIVQNVRLLNSASELI